MDRQWSTECTLRASHPAARRGNVEYTRNKPSMSKPCIPYTDSVEVIQPGEEQTFDEIAARRRDIAYKIGSRAGNPAAAI